MRVVIVIRHGESEHHLNGLTGGWTDCGLTDLGRRQASLLAERLARDLAGQPRIGLYCSDLKRAAETAEIVGRTLGLTPVPMRALREFNNGQAAGLTVAEAERIELPRTLPILDWQPHPEAETYRRFYERVATAMDDLDRREAEAALIVTHGGTHNLIVTWWLRLGVDALNRVSFAATTTGVTLLTYNRWNERTIERLNDTSHIYAVGLAPKLDIGAY